MVVVAVVSDLSKPRSGAKAGFGGLIQFTNWVGGDPGAHASVIRVHTSVGALPKRPQNAVARTASTCHYRTGRAHSCSHSSCWWWCDGECSCDPHCCPWVALGEGRRRDRRRPVRAQRLGLMERCSKKRVVSAVEFARWIRTRPDQAYGLAGQDLTVQQCPMTTGKVATLMWFL